MPQTIRLEFAKSNTKVSKPKQQPGAVGAGGAGQGMPGSAGASNAAAAAAAAAAASAHQSLMHPALTGREYYVPGELYRSRVRRPSIPNIGLGSLLTSI
jgi:hypothetical protein